MEIIKKLSHMIEKEIKQSHKYIMCALKYKEERPALADTFYKIADEKMKHMSLLHTQVTNIIEQYRKENGEPPEHMLLLYDILHK